MKKLLGVVTVLLVLGGTPAVGAQSYVGSNLETGIFYVPTSDPGPGTVIDFSASGLQPLSEVLINLFDLAGNEIDGLTVVLGASPVGQVVFAISSDPQEAAVSPSALTFTSANWNMAQAVSVTGVDDLIVDGDQATDIRVAVDAANSDSAFRGLPEQVIDVVTLGSTIVDINHAGYNSNQIFLGQGAMLNGNIQLQTAVQFVAAYFA